MRVRVEAEIETRMHYSFSLLLADVFIEFEAKPNNL